MKSTNHVYQIMCHICEKKLKHKYKNDKNYHKTKDHKYRVVAYGICSLKYSIPYVFLRFFTMDSTKIITLS